MTPPDLAITTLTEWSPATRDRIARYYEGTGQPLTEAEWSHLCERLADGRCQMVLASLAGVDVGGLYLNWQPLYQVYRHLEVPELQDLRVYAAARRQGIARALVVHAEAMAQAKGAQGLGIAVGLYADYGPAQCLYAAMGYQPDGQGVTYTREMTRPGQLYRLDDDFCLMLIKFFA